MASRSTTCRRSLAAAEGFATTALLDLTAGVARETTDRALDQLRGSGVTLSGAPVIAS